MTLQPDNDPSWTLWMYSFHRRHTDRSDSASLACDFDVVGTCTLRLSLGTGSVFISLALCCRFRHRPVLLGSLLSNGRILPPLCILMGHQADEERITGPASRLKLE